MSIPFGILKDGCFAALSMTKMYNPRENFNRGGVLPELKLDDIVRLRKSHPCGSTDWKVVRLGADIGIVCLGCGRRVLLERRQLVKQLKKLNPPDPQLNK